MYRGCTQTDYQNKHYNINQKDEGTQDDRGRDGRTNFILRIKEQETCLTLQEHCDDELTNISTTKTDNMIKNKTQFVKYADIFTNRISSIASTPFR